MGYKMYRRVSLQVLAMICLSMFSITAWSDNCPKGAPYNADLDRDGYTNAYCRIKTIHYAEDGSSRIDMEYVPPKESDDKCPTIYSIQNTSTTCQFDYTGANMDGKPDGKVDISDAKWIQQQATSADGPTQVPPASPGDHTADGLISYHDLCYFMTRSGYRSQIQQTCQMTFPELGEWL